MKLGKDEFQKIFLGIIVLIGLLYFYFNILLAPLNKQETNSRNAIADLAPKIASNKALIKDVAALEKKGPATLATLEGIKSLIPAGAPIAWFPPLINEFFKAHGIEKSGVHVGGGSADRDLPGFENLTWNLDIPHVEVVPLASAIAQLENEHPLLEIVSLHIDALKDDVQYQQAGMTISTIVKQ